MKKVKILILGSKEYPFGCGDDKIKSGGIETYTEGLVDELKKNKDINIAIITRKFQNQKSHQINENIEIWRVNWIRGFYFRNISFNFSAFIKAFSLDFDVILAQGPIAVFFSVILSKFKKFKLIARCAGISTSQPQYSKVLRKIFFYLEKYVYERADAVVFGSAEEKTQFEKKLGFMPKNNKIIPSGVKIHIFVSDKKTIEKYNPKNKTLICFVGRLLQVKGVKYLIQAVNMLDKKIQEKIKILIVGDGTLRIELETLAKDNYLNDIIEFTGHKSKEECNQIMQISDIFILPSISEGLPLAVLEAMANKCTLIVTDIGLPVKNKKDGLVVAPKNPEEIKNAIELLMSNRELREELSKNAFEKVKKEYTWKKAVEKYLKIVE